MQIELDAFYDSMAGVVSPATVVFYRCRLKSLGAFLGDIPLSDVTLNHLRTWRRWLSEREHKYQGTARAKPGRLSPWTVHQYVRCCRRFFTWCVAEGLIDHSPAGRLEKPPLPRGVRRGISPDARDSIIRVANCARDLALLLVLADTACRLAGIAGMRVDDVDLPGRRVLVREKGRGGNQRERFVFMSDRTAGALAAWLVERGDAQTRKVWVSRDGHGLTGNGVYQLVRRAAKRAGVTNGWNPHNWRHGAIRGMLNAGAPISAVAQIAGHSSVQVTGDIYGTFTDCELLAVHDRSSWIK